MPGSPILNYVPLTGTPGSGTASSAGIYLYWDFVTLLTGGTPLPATNGGGVSNSLDQNDISSLPDKTLIKVVTATGASEWLRVLDITSPATDTNAGVIKPANYDPVARPFVLHRQSGF